MEASQTPSPQPSPGAPVPPAEGEHRVAGILLAVLFGLIAASLIALTIALMGLTLCEDKLESGCSQDSSSVHTFKVIFGWAASIASVVALVSAVQWRRGGSSSRLIGAVVATVVFTAMLFIL
jgi:hypothetical protein